MKTKAIIFLLLFSLLTTTCKKEANPSVASQSGSKIMVTGQDESAGLKTTMSGLNVSWVATSDKIGLYCAQANSNGTNAAYTASTTGSTSAFTGSMTWGSGTHTFYAYYPWVAGSAASTVVPISLSATQTQTGTNNNHIGALDFTVASATATPGTSGQPVDVNLSFRHVFTVLEFNLKLASGSSTDLSSIELYSTDSNLSLTSGTIDLTQATPAGDNSYTLVSPVGTKKVTLNTSGCTLSTGASISAYMMILPGNQVGSTSSDMTIKVTSVAGVTVVVKSGINFVRGKRYTIDLTGLTFSGSVSDIDSHTYQTVTIGTQVWMASNLNTSKYNDGTAITNVTDNTTWTNATTGVYCDYSNTASNSTTYGKLYNWFVVDNNASTKVASNGNKNVCPVGWHMPSDAEWTTLTAYLEGESVAGGKLKENGTSHWTTPNTGATNETGFTALPGGFRYYNGTFYDIGINGFWWSSTENTTSTAKERHMSYGSAIVTSGIADKLDGFSVRCLRD